MCEKESVVGKDLSSRLSMFGGGELEGSGVGLFSRYEVNVTRSGECFRFCIPGYRL